jgi:hypothetical protein
MRHGYLSLTVMVCLILLGASLATAQIVSDDFNAYNLKTSVWTLTDPLGDATISLNGTGTDDATLSLIVPEGKSHDLWTTGYNVPRIMQAAPNVDFEVEVKYQSTVSQAYQIQGVIVEQDTSNLLRIEFNSSGNDVNLFAASFKGGLGSPAIRINTNLGPQSAPLYLRVRRAGHTWALTYSTDGSIWNDGGSFVDTLVVHKVGLFAGNSGESTIPADTTIVDYFFNNAAPIAAEDSARSITDTTPPLIYDVHIASVPNGLLVTWKTDEPATSAVDFGKTVSYESGTETVPGTTLSHSVNLTGLTGGTLYNIRISSNDNHPNNKRTTGNYTATTLPGPTITVWYGQDQPFGYIGVPQRNADILGNVTGPSRIISLSYSLNGAAPESLSVGPDGRLLQNAGDFKINLPYAALPGGASTVVITAIDSIGTTTRDTVTVNHHTGAVWPLPYAVSWGGTNSLRDSVQVVDGKWSRTGQGVRIIETGYDRTIAIGDTSWKNYEVTAEITVNKIDSSAQAFSPSNGGPALGFIFRWVGHTNLPTFDPPVTQPMSGYLPLGCFGVYSWRKGFGSTLANEWSMLGNNLAIRAEDSSVSNAIHYGVKYVIKMQVSSLTETTPYYRLKVWQSGQAEPATWMLNAQETPDDPQHGSALLVAHFVDVTLGRVTAKQLGSDAIAPQIGSIVVDRGAHSANVTWGTNELTSGWVAYGTTAAYADTVKEPGAPAYLHGLLLSGLTPNMLYHFALIAVDTAGNVTVSKDTTFTTKAALVPTTFVSDEFNQAKLDSTVWTFVNPAADGSSISKLPTAVRFHLPADTAHDLWSSGYKVPRLMQNVNNSDFDIEARFDSSLSHQYQLEGIVIEQDSVNVIRLDLNTDGSKMHAFVATFANGLGSPVVIADSVVGPNGTKPLWMRIKRQDNIWTYSYSVNGTTWVTVATFYNVMTVRKVGLFAGNAGDTPPATNVVVDYIRTVGTVVANVRINVKVALEGAYVSAGDTMRTRLTSVLPRTQPYTGAPWNYAGAESLATVPATAVDWVLVSVRSDTALATTVAQRAGLLLKDGKIVDVDGTSPLEFPTVTPGTYYVVVSHRNHLAVMSAAKITADSAATQYDFTTGLNKAYGANAMKSVGSKYGLFAGDANMDGQVTSLDFDQFNPKFRSAATGYQITDWNLDGQVTSLDFDLFNPNFRAAAISRVPK